LTESSGDARGLVDRGVEDDGDMCREHGGVVDKILQRGFGGFGLKTTDGRFLVWASKPGWNFGGNDRRLVVSS
jgi:hypothetical protein